MRRVLSSLDAVPRDCRQLAVALHWAMASVRSQWAAVHQVGEGGKPHMLCCTAKATDDGGSQALFDFLGGDLTAAVDGLVGRAMASGRALALGRGAADQGLPCAALCMPLLDSDGRTPLGAVTLLCSDLGRSWTSDEQQLLATAAPLFGLHLTRERLATQALLLHGAMTADDQARGKMLAEHAAKVVHEMRGVHADEMKTRRDGYRKESSPLTYP